MSLFCNENNIEHCAHVLSGELEVLGFPSITYDAQNEKAAIMNLLNTSWSLVNNSKKHALKINMLNEKTIHLSRKVSDLEDRNRKLVLRLDDEKNKLSTLQSNITYLCSEKDKALLDLAIMKKELEKANHAIQKKELHLEKLQSKLLDSEHLQTPRSDRLKNSSPRENLPAVLDTSLYSNYILSLRNNVQLLLNENVSLRSSIISIYFLFLNHRNRDVEPLKTKLFNLPYQSIIDEIEKDIKSLLTSST